MAIPRTIEAAVEYLQTAAQQRVVGAMTSLAHRCDKIQLLALPAHCSSLCHVARRYLDGTWVEKSVTEAKCWLQEAIDTIERREARPAEAGAIESALDAAEFEAEGLPDCMHEPQEIKDLLFEIDELEIVLLE